MSGVGRRLTGWPPRRPPNRGHASPSVGNKLKVVPQTFSEPEVAPPTRKRASGFTAMPPVLAPAQASRDEARGTPRARPQPARRRKELPCPKA
jgi:hypothetical protein